VIVKEAGLLDCCALWLDNLFPKFGKNWPSWSRFDYEFISVGCHKSETGCKYICIGLEFCVSDCTVLWKKLGDECRVDTQ